MKKVLIVTYDMAVGGVERSLIALLQSFDYSKFEVDLLICKHEGEFLSYIPKGPKLLPEISAYATLRTGILEIVNWGHYKIALKRILLKYEAKWRTKKSGFKESGILALQLASKYTAVELPMIEKQYDIAISYLWPHHITSQCIKASKKIAWIHTDYRELEIDHKEDREIWDQYDRLMAVSEGCKKAFLHVYPELGNKIMVIENLNSVEYIKEMSLDLCELDHHQTESTVMLTVGRFVYAKGMDQAVRACRELIDRGYKIKWYVIGFGGEEEVISQLIRELNLEEDFILLGKKINPYPYMRACDIYVQPSLYEAKAVTVTEAQIVGKPVLITRYNTAESQIKDGFDGVICEQGVNGIVAGIIELIDNPEKLQKLSENTRCSDYSNKKELEKLYDVLSSC